MENKLDTVAEILDRIIEKVERLPTTTDWVIALAVCAIIFTAMMIYL